MQKFKHFAKTAHLLADVASRMLPLLIPLILVHLLPRLTFLYLQPWMLQLLLMMMLIIVLNKVYDDALASSVTETIACANTADADTTTTFNYQYCYSSFNCNYHHSCILTTTILMMVLMLVMIFIILIPLTFLHSKCIS